MRVYLKAIKRDHAAPLNEQGYRDQMPTEVQITAGTSFNSLVSFWDGEVEYVVSAEQLMRAVSAAYEMVRPLKSVVSPSEWR